MIGALLSIYRPKFPRVIVYMLQSTEYEVVPYLKWLWRATNFNRVMHRKGLVMTRPARLLLTVLRVGMLAQLTAAIIFGLLAYKDSSALGVTLMLALLLATPVIWAHVVIVPLVLGRWLIIKPYSWFLIKRSARIFATHPAAKIAIAGSYGKTTMKEILATVLSASKKVAATPANRNVSISHAQFAKTLKGDEEILIIEYGEGAPGDIGRFTRITKPNVGIITGLAPAHLDKYKTLQAAGEDIFVLADYLHNHDVYVNGESQELLPFTKKSHILYTSERVAGWKISDIKADLEGLSFNMKKGSVSLNLKSSLVGRHLVAPVALAAYLGDEVGLSKKEIEEAVAKIKPFEHRMEARQAGGAWIIDDTYNGNIEGMEAGLQLLAGLSAKRKIYVTPGLVEQGEETRRVHLRLGKAIAKAAPDVVVLMRHSVTDDIKRGLEEGGYKGRLTIEDDPLEFYENLNHFVASGDIVLMQNDWPDNYYN